MRLRDLLFPLILVGGASATLAASPGERMVQAEKPAVRDAPAVRAPARPASRPAPARSRTAPRSPVAGEPSGERLEVQCACVGMRGIA